MALSIENWNINENICWYVRMAAGVSSINAELYLSESDASAQTNLQASGSSLGFGVSREIALTNEESATTPVSLFQPEYTWHIKVSGESGDTTKIFKIKEFVELDEITDSIYRSSYIIQRRATAEINAHTHAKITKTVPLGIHIPTLEVGQIVRLNSTRRSVNELAQVLSHRIVGTPNSLINEIDMAKFIGLKR
jgi:hypothetical protein